MCIVDKYTVNLDNMHKDSLYYYKNRLAIDVG